jgi:hypothetical protein
MSVKCPSARRRAKPTGARPDLSYRLTSTMCQRNVNAD